MILEGHEHRVGDGRLSDLPVQRAIVRPWNGGVKHILQSRLAVDDEARPLSEIGQDDRGVNDETEGQLACEVSCADMS